MTFSFVAKSSGLEGLPLFRPLVGAEEEASPESVGGLVSPEAGAEVEATEEATKCEATKKGLKDSLKGASSGASSEPSKGRSSLQEETERSSFAGKTLHKGALPKERASSKGTTRTRPYPGKGSPSSPSPSFCGEVSQDEGEEELFNGLWPEIWVSLKRWEAYMKERDPEWLKAFLSVDP